MSIVVLSIIMFAIVILLLAGCSVIIINDFFSLRTSLITCSAGVIISIGILIANIAILNSYDVRDYTPYEEEIVSEFYTANEIIMKGSILPVNEDGTVISNDIGANDISLIEIKDNEDSESLDKIVITKVSGKSGWLTSEWYEAVIYK